MRVVLLIAILVLVPVTGMAQKKGKAKKKEPFVLTMDFNHVAPCDKLYMPWLTRLPVFLDRLKTDGVRKIDWDSSTILGDSWRAIEVKDDYYRYRFTFDSAQRYVFAQVTMDYQDGVSAYMAFKSYCKMAEMNYAWPDEENYKKEFKKEYQHHCSKWTANLSVEVYDDTEIWLFYACWPGMDIRDLKEK